MIANTKQKKVWDLGCPIEFTRPIVVRLHARAPFNEAAMRNSTISVILAVIFGSALARPWQARRRCENHPRKNSKAFAIRPVGRFRRTQVATVAEQTARERLGPIACSLARMPRKAASRRFRGVRAQQAL